MNTVEIVKKLKQEAETNDTARAVFLLWAMRQRARNTITVHSLVIAMSKQGFYFPAEKYRLLLKFLASLELGRLKVNSKGRVMALQEVSIKLQSIGKAALNQQVSSFERIKRQPRFKSLMQPQHMPLPVISRKLVLTVILGEKKAIDIQIPPNLTTEDLSSLFQGLQNVDLKRSRA